MQSRSPCPKVLCTFRSHQRAPERIELMLTMLVAIQHGRATTVWKLLELYFVHKVAFGRRHPRGLSIFESSSHLSFCLPHTVEASHCQFLLLNAKQESCEYQIFIDRRVPLLFPGQGHLVNKDISTITIIDPFKVGWI